MIYIPLLIVDEINELKHKEYTQSAEASAQAAFDKKLAQEEVWIRQGIKARRTRNEGRVRALKKMRQEFKDRQQKIGKVKLSQQTTELSGKEVLVAENLNFAYGDAPIIKDFSCIIQRGDKVGILGPNGAGKSTLIKLLLKQLEPISGHVKHGTKLDIVYFDQHRQAEYRTGCGLYHRSDAAVGRRKRNHTCLDHKHKKTTHLTCIHADHHADFLRALGGPLFLLISTETQRPNQSLLKRAQPL